MFLSYSDYSEMASDLLDGSYLYFNPKDKLITSLIHIISSELIDRLPLLMAMSMALEVIYRAISMV